MTVQNNLLKSHRLGNLVCMKQAETHHKHHSKCKKRFGEVDHWLSFPTNLHQTLIKEDHQILSDHVTFLSNSNAF